MLELWGLERDSRPTQLFKVFRMNFAPAIVQYLLQLWQSVLSVMTSELMFSLDGNQIGDAGAVGIGESLAKHVALERL
jgi:hypothetical protein